MSRRRIPPVALVAGALVLQRLIARKTRRSCPARLAAVATAAGSGYLLLSAATRFQHEGTTVNPLEVGADVLVVDGPNRFTRNPMYLGMVGVLVAHALWRGSASALLPAAAFVAVIDRLQIPVEEAYLQEHFGDAYRAYKAATPRWLRTLTPSITPAMP